MGTPMSREKVLIKNYKIRNRIIKAVLEMDAAKREFEIFKHGPTRNEDLITPEWKAMCEATGTLQATTFEDICC